MEFNLDKIDFQKISEIISEENTITDSINSALEPATLMNVDAFHVNRERLYEEIEILPNQTTPSMSDIQDFFKQIEEIPTKLQRVNKKNHAKELQRVVSNPSVHGTGKKDITTTSCLMNDSNNSSNLSVKLETDNEMNAVEIYNDFKSITSKLEELIKENCIKNIANFHENKVGLENAKKFIDNLTNISPTLFEECQKTLTSKQEKYLEELANTMEKYLYIQENENLFEQNSFVDPGPESDYNSKLENEISYIEIVSNILKDIKQ